MLSPETIAKLNSMIDGSHAAAARAEFDRVTLAEASNRAEIAAAEAEVQEAEGARSLLTQAAAAGGDVPAKQLTAAVAAIGAARDRLALRQDVARELARRSDGAQAAMAAAPRLGAEPVARHAVAELLAATDRIAAARTELAAAETAYDEAAGLLAYLSGQGWALKRTIRPFELREILDSQPIRLPRALAVEILTESGFPLPAEVQS